MCLRLKVALLLCAVGLCVSLQNGFTQAEYPGLPANNPLDANYTEALLVGYRWFDAQNSAPRFPFGHGLSYTTFDYSDIVVSESYVTITCTSL